jgi:hypothetical protein
MYHSKWILAVDLSDIYYLDDGNNFRIAAAEHAVKWLRVKNGRPHIEIGCEAKKFWFIKFSNGVLVG